MSPDEESKAMFVARLENLGLDATLTVRDILALLSDCDYLASIQVE